MAVASHPSTVCLWEEHGPALPYPASRKLKSTMSCPCRLLLFKLNKGTAAPLLFGCPVLPPHGHSTFLWSHSNFSVSLSYRGIHSTPDADSQLPHVAEIPCLSLPARLRGWWLSLQARAVDSTLNLLSTGAQAPLLQRPDPSLLESVPHEKLCTCLFLSAINFADG